jgi:hypothetical protein
MKFAHKNMFTDGREHTHEEYTLLRYKGQALPKIEQSNRLHVYTINLDEALANLCDAILGYQT